MKICIVQQPDWDYFYLLYLLHRESLSFRPTSHPEHFESLNGLACALGDRFGKTGSMMDLEEAISMLREALPLSSTAHHLLVLKNLAWFLETWYKENGSQSDFEEAISLCQEILAISKWILLYLPHYLILVVPRTALQFSHSFTGMTLELEACK